MAICIVLEFNDLAIRLKDKLDFRDLLCPDSDAIIQCMR
jgi:hypothetical protein